MMFHCLFHDFLSNANFQPCQKFSRTSTTFLSRDDPPAVDWWVTACLLASGGISSSNETSVSSRPCEVGVPRPASYCSSSCCTSSQLSSSSVSPGMLPVQPSSSSSSRGNISWLSYSLSTSDIVGNDGEMVRRPRLGCCSLQSTGIVTLLRM